MLLIVRIDFSEISFRCWNEQQYSPLLYSHGGYYAEFYSHADEQWKYTWRKNLRSLIVTKDSSSTRFHRWLQFNDRPYSLFITVRAHSGRLTFTVFHLQSINIPVRELRRWRGSSGWDMRREREKSHARARARARDFICPDTWLTWCTRQVRSARSLPRSVTHRCLV